jgi:transcription elongation factor GreA
MSDRIPMTRAGYDKLKAEVDHFETVEMPTLAQRIAAARSEGDLSENAEYHGARESQGMLQAKINVLRDKLARAVIVERAKEATNEVVFGATVVVKDLKFGDEESYVLVGAGEEVRGTLAAGRVHAHVQHGLLAVGKTSVTSVKLMRRDPKIK